MHALLGAVLLLAGSNVYKTPLPLPDLVGVPQAEVTKTLGKEERAITGDEAEKICQKKCDALLVYGPPAPLKPTVTASATYVYLKNGIVSSVKWVYAGDTERPGDYPPLRKLFADGTLPDDAEVIAASDPITIDRVTDNLHRTIRWSEHGMRWTALVSCPLVRAFDAVSAQRVGVRAALMEEYLAMVIEAGPAKVPPRPLHCTPGSPEPFFVWPSMPDHPKVKHEPRIVFPPWQADGGFTGTVVMEYVVGTNGSVESVTPVRGHPAFNENAVAGIMRWQYEPFLCEGKPARWKARTDIHFGGEN